MKNILFPLAIAALAVPGYAQNPRTPIQLDAGLGAPVGPSVATDGELSAIVWKESGTDNMYVSTSTDQGCTWSVPTRIDDSTNLNGKFAKDIGTVVDGGNIYASWSDQRTVDNEDDLYLTVSNDGGLTWSADMVIDKGYANGANDLKDWRIAVDGLNVAMMSATENDGGGAQEEVFLTVSTDGGATFGTAMAASLHPNGTVDVDAISMAMSNGVVHMVWQDNNNTSENELFYSSYDFGTASFTSMDVNIGGSLALGNIENDLSISANGSNVAVAYQADNLPTSSAHILHVNVSNDNGVTWNGGALVGGYVAGTDDTDHPIIVANSNGNVTVGWEDNRNGSDEMFLANSIDNGATWSETASGLAGGFPAIAGDGDYVAFNFTGGAFPEGSWVMTSRDGGVTFGAPVDMAVGQTLGDADFAELAFNSEYQNFLACWHSDDSGANQIFAGGARSAGLTPVGPFTAGGPINFTGAGFGASEAGNQFMVLVSTAKGTTAIPGDGRSVGLAFNNVLTQSAASAALKATILADGTAATPVVSFPGSFAIGTTLSCVALSRLSGSYDAITDVMTFTVE